MAGNRAEPYIWQLGIFAKREMDHLRHSLRPLITGTGTLATTSASSRGPNATRSVWWKLRDLALSKVATNLTRTERAKSASARTSGHFFDRTANTVSEALDGR